MVGDAVRLIDDGPDKVELWAAVEEPDEYGTPVMVAPDPDVTPPDATIYTHVQLVAATEGSADLGQAASDRFTFQTARQVPDGAWTLVRWAGALYDVDGPAPRVGRSERTAHRRFTLVSRRPR